MSKFSNEMRPQETLFTPSEKNFIFRSLIEGLTELLFVFLPLLILFIISFYKGNVISVWQTSEWSFAASILFGQGTIRIVGSVTDANMTHPKREVVEFIASAMIVVGVAPSLLVLTLILISSTPPIWLIILQIILFILGIIAFLFSKVIEGLIETYKRQVEESN